MNSFTALFWKEYRQQIMLLVSIFALGVFIMLGTGILTLTQSESGSFIGIAVAMTALYAASATAIIFAREHEENTFVFLRSLPVSPSKLALAKIAWIVTSVLIIAVAGICTGLIFGQIFSNHGDDLSVIAGVYGVAIIEGFSWGIFWSPRIRTQIAAILAVFISFALESYIACIVYLIIYDVQTPTLGVSEYVGAGPIRILAVLPFAIIGIRNASLWLRRSSKNEIGIEREPVHIGKEISMERILARKPIRGSFRQLMIQGFRQSKTLMLYMIGFEILLFTWLFFNYYFGRTMKDIAISGDFYLVGAIGLISVMVFCGSVFSVDQKYARAALPIEHGISSGKIWFSRILLFGTVYFVPLVILYILGVAGGYLNIVQDVLIESWLFSWTRNFIFNIPIFFALIAIGCFCIGQFCSIVFRSMTVSLAVSGILNSVFIFWTIVMIDVFGFSPLWSALPILLSCLIASRVYCNRWIRKRKGFRALKPALGIVCGTIAAIIIAVPFVRVYSVPVFDLGYRSEYCSPDYIHQGEFVWLERENRNRERYTALLMDKQASDGKDFEIRYWDEIQNSLKNHWRSSYSHINNNSDYFYYHTGNTFYDAETGAELLAIEDAKKQIRLLEYVSEKRVSTRVRVKRLYESEYRMISYGYPPSLNFWECNPEFMIYRFLPWERTRALRLMNNRFQQLSRSAEDIEMAISDGIGDLDEIFETDRVYEREMLNGKRHRSELVLLEGRWIRNIRPVSVYYTELERRMKLLRLGLYIWYKEHGELPESLDQLSVYLKEVPKTPYYGTEFEYAPHPDGSELPDKVNYNTHKAGVPYIYFREREMLSDLSFTKEYREWIEKESASSE